MARLRSEAHAPVAPSVPPAWRRLWLHRFLKLKLGVEPAWSFTPGCDNDDDVAEAVAALEAQLDRLDKRDEAERFLAQRLDRPHPQDDGR